MIEAFEFTPKFQVDETDPMVFTLKPLGLSASTAMDVAQLKDLDYHIDTMLHIAGKHVLSWRGGGVEPALDPAAVRARLVAIFEGTDPRWKAWLSQVAQHLQRLASPSEDAAKKS